MALDKLTKIDGGGISTTSNYRVGIITASKFIGPFDGSVGNFSGIITALGANFSGNVTIGGTLTYEDVTNIDSVGIITAQSDIHVGAGVSAVGVGTFSGLDINGNVDISGDLDVDGHTNLDNVSIAGVTTFSDNIHVQSSDDTLALFESTDSLAQIQFKDNSSNANLPTIGVEANSFYFNNMGSTSLRIAPGKVGVNEVTPLADFHVNQNEAHSSTYYLDGDAGVLIENINNAATRKSVLKLVGDSAIVYGGSGNGTLTFAQRQKETASFDTNGNFSLNYDLDVDGHTNLDNVSISGVTTISSSGDALTIGAATNAARNLIFSADRNADAELGSIIAKNTGGNIAAISFYAGDDGTNKDNGQIVFRTSPHSGQPLFERMRLTEGGNLLFGITEAHTTVLGGRGPRIQLESTTVDSSSIFLNRDGNDGGGPYLFLGHGRGGSGLIQDGDNLGNLMFVGGTGSNFRGAANISCLVDIPSGGAASNTSMPGALVLSTSNHNQTSPVEAMRIRPDGRIVMGGSTAVSFTPHGNADDLVVGATSAANRGITILGGNNNRASIYFGDTDDNDVGQIDYNHNNNAMVFHTNADERLRITSGGDIQVDNGNLHIDDNGEFAIFEQNTSLAMTNSSKISMDFSGNVARIRSSHNGSGGNAVSRPLAFYIGSSEKLKIDTSGHILPGAAGTQDLGSTSLEWGDVYLADNKRLKLGSDQDMMIYHDNIHGYVSNRKANLYLSAPTYVMITSTDTNGSNEKTSARFLRDGSSEIYYSDSLKFETSATGITVTGEVAATQDYPNTRPLLDFNFAATKKLDPRLEYRRTGPASFVNEFGNVVLVGDNTPRFDHDPITRESKGIFIEESRTNLVEDNTNYSIGWADYSSTHAKTTDVKAPDGSYNAWKVTSTGTQSQFGLYDAIAYTANTKYTHSMWLKAGSVTRVGLTVSSGSRWSPMPYLVVDLDTGTVAATGSSLSTKLTAYPNGWYLLEATGQFGSTSQVDGIWSYTAQTGGFSGNTTAYYYQWGGQVEEGAFATSFIPTNGANTTRGRDELTMSGSDLTDVFNNEEGTIFYEASLENLTNDNQPIVAFRDLGTVTANYHAMGWRIGGGTSVIRTWFKTSSNNEHLSAHSSTGLTANMFYKHIYGYKDADCADAYRTPTNSGILSNQTGNGSPMIAAGVVDELRFGGYYAYESQPTTYGLDGGHIKRFSYWRQKLTNAQLTTYIS